MAVVGGGLLGEQLEEHLGNDGYHISMVAVRYTRKGDVSLMDEEQASRQLGAVDFVINLLPRGKDFLGCRLHRQLAETAIIIDFSRPPIPIQAIPQRIVMGNRVQRNSMHFFMRLPGGWQRHELPACSMPSLVASLTALPVSNIADFHFAAGKCQFYTALAGAPLQRHQTIGSRLRAFTALHPIINT